ncbi:MAG: sigma-70 family RNA polymerase sigma factor [Desulfobulbaceae bacterium]|nr:sigma-70 family RNA polymerase sigma factor [Desulfobulbaceae bacterium]
MELFSLTMCLMVIGVLLNSSPGHVQQNNDRLAETIELVMACQAGNRQAFNRLVVLYQTRIYNLALNYVKTPEEANDLVQDIFVTTYRSLPSLREPPKFSAWLNQLALNHCRNRYRKLQRSGFFTSTSTDDIIVPELLSSDTPEHNMERDERIKMVRKVIASMPETEKEIIILRDLQELSYEEISDTLGLPLGTVKSKLNRARHTFKNKIKHLLSTP